jgi:hypothetical protein
VHGGRELWERGLQSALFVLDVRFQGRARTPLMFDFDSHGDIFGPDDYLCPGDEHADIGLGCRLEYVPAIGLPVGTDHSIEHLIDMSFWNIVDITADETGPDDRDAMADHRALLESEMFTQVTENRADIWLALAPYAGRSWSGA